MLLIDGYNLMHAAGLMRPQFGPGGLERARRALIGVLAGSLSDKAPGTVVVFDGPLDPPQRDPEVAPAPTHGIRVEFAGGVEAADARIEQLIRLDSAPKRLTVVSSDSRIRAAARRRGARALPSQQFWDKLVQRRRSSRTESNAAQDKPQSRSSDDPEFWLRQFEGRISDDDLRELAGPFSEQD